MRRSHFSMMMAVLLFATPGLAGEKVAAFLDGASSSLGPSAATVLALLKVELERNDLTVVQMPGWNDTFPGVEAVRAQAASEGVTRVFVLSAMPLGGKIVLGLSERGGAEFTVTASERMTATQIEELDAVIPRLVTAVLERQTANATAEVDTVTAQEGRKWNKKAGEFLYGVGIPFGVALRSGAAFSYGFMGRAAYEMESARIDLLSLVQFNDAKSEQIVHWNIVIDGHYLFLKTNISPFVGAGMGFAYTHLNDKKDFRDGAAGIVFDAVVGVEFFRLYHTRLIFDTRVSFPTFSLHAEGRSHWVPVLTSALSFLW